MKRKRKPTKQQKVLRRFSQFIFGRDEWKLTPITDDQGEEVVGWIITRRELLG